MPHDSMPPSEVTSMELVQVREKADAPGQRRNFNYIVRVSTADAESGEPILVNEYRTYATDTATDAETVIQRLTELLEGGLEAL